MIFTPLLLLKLMTCSHKLCDRFTTLHLQITQTYSFDVCVKVSRLTFLHVSVRQGPSSGNQTKVVQHETKLLYTTDVV